jgi:hypothetical protein
VALLLAIVILLGAEFNAEMEYQAARDTTTAGTLVQDSAGHSAVPWRSRSRSPPVSPISGDGGVASPPGKGLLATRRPEAAWRPGQPIVGIAPARLS